MKIIHLKTSFEDKRGKIIDLLDHENIDAVTWITFKKGAVRGNHYHKETIQWNYVVSGKILLRTKPLEKGKILDTIMSKGDFIVAVPNERHALQALENSILLVLTKGPRGGKEYESDTFRDEIPLITSG